MDIAAMKNNGGLTQGTQSAKSKMNLKTEDFIKMMITQLQNQDPMEPAKNDQLLAQMSQISQLQSSTNLTDSLKSMVQQNNLSAAGSMIGKMVKGKDATGAEVNGVVSSVKVEDGALFLELDNGKKMGLSDVTNIASASEIGQTPVPTKAAAAA